MARVVSSTAFVRCFLSFLYSASVKPGGGPELPPPPLPLLSPIVLLFLVFVVGGCAERLDEPAPACAAAVSVAYNAENDFYRSPEDSQFQERFHSAMAAIVSPASCSPEYTSYLGIIRSNSYIARSRYTIVLAHVDSLIASVPPSAKRGNAFGPAYRPADFRARLMRHKARALLQTGDADGAVSVYEAIEATDLPPGLERIHLDIYAGEAYLERSAAGDKAPVLARWEAAWSSLRALAPVDSLQNIYRNHLLSRVHTNLAQLYASKSTARFPVAERDEGRGAAMIVSPGVALVVASIILIVWLASILGARRVIHSHLDVAPKKRVR